VYFVRGEMAGKLIRGISELWGKMVVPYGKNVLFPYFGLRHCPNIGLAMRQLIHV